MQLRRHGLAVPLARDRRPFVSGFNRWSRPPSERTVARWYEQYPDANIGLVPATLLGSELDSLCRLNSRIGPDAFALLAWLRIQHSARSSRGETFNITPKAMARDQVIYGWERRRYMRAHDLLLLAGLIEKVAKFRNTRFGPVGSQYRLTKG